MGRRKTDKDILEKAKGLIALSVVFILVGIFTMIIPYILPLPDYSALQTKEVTVSEFDVRHSYRAGYTAYMHTTDGETYSIKGTHSNAQLQELLTNGKTVTIKWCEVPVSAQVIEEISVDGEQVVTYDNDWVNECNKKYVWIGAIWPIALGVGGIIFVKWELNHNRETQRKRDERIKRKYGKLKK